MPKSLLDRTAVALFKTVPTRAAHHLLFLAQSEPDLADRWGYHIRPIHYYEPLPDFRAITADQISRKRAFPAIDFRWEAQLALLDNLAAYRDELTKLEFDFDNDFFSGFDAAIYYSLIRHLKPRRVIEIGGGYSTHIASKALSVNENGTLTCIEPYPEKRVADLNVELITRRVEEIDVDFFSCLGTNDILFIDSSHTVKFGSDVCYEFLEILPRLATGVWVHVHDIFFPHDYPADWLINRRLALNEQYLLEAFLAFNTAFSVELANYWICLEHPDHAAQLAWRGLSHDPTLPRNGTDPVQPRDQAATGLSRAPTQPDPVQLRDQAATGLSRDPTLPETVQLRDQAATGFSRDPRLPDPVQLRDQAATGLSRDPTLPDPVQLRDQTWIGSVPQRGSVGLNASSFWMKRVV